MKNTGENAMNLRNNVRANLHVRVTLQGTDRLGMPFQVSGESVDFSRKGLGIVLDQDIIAPGSIISVSSAGKFRSDAAVQWVAPDSETGQTRLGLRLLEPKANIIFKTAAAVLLSLAVLGQVSFARSRAFSRRATASQSCVVSLEQMKIRLDKALNNYMHLTGSEKAFIHVQHQHMGCDEYTRQFEISGFFRDAKKREAMASWHWKYYHSNDPGTRIEAVMQSETALGGGSVESIPVAANLQSSDLR